ncbi:PP2C family protein-serine/threonine phosphatase [Nocardioides hwasunensis]|uniref:Serine/threonine-protein phosphatase n=1 Tax=Nocardioides hwasunensis TaxID=397258 RepID=A0ABR8ML78_9ACTN|nr:protein phosphatase 2C domain-containing protein [Nocardioides hwasunensis]MBD3916330.1 serine/threonine-protein phosphatase [Nocardioides hwasunensis]
MSLYLHYSAISDVGRVRRENQDSGYAGPWLLTVCDGVGGAVRGDLASSTAVQALRKLDQRPDEDILGQVAGGVHRADDRIAELVEEDPALNGTSTTATVALFDGARFGLGHIGDSRAYLYRRGELRQLTHDHTFVQSLIDEGRITEEQSRTHPHRNLILKALDGIRHEEPDLFEFPAEAGDRIFLCSDGACGTLSLERMADILSTGTPDFAAVELVRASLEAGSTDNVTCIVADVSEEPAPDDLAPLLVGAAADLPRRMPVGGGVGGAVGGLFRGHRAGDTGEIAPVPAEAPEGAFVTDPIDPEAARYAPLAPTRYTWLRRVLVAAVLLGITWVVLATGWSWSQQQFYVGDHDGKVTIFRGLNADLPGISLSHPYETTDVEVDLLSDIDAEQVREGIEADDLDDARATVDNYAARQDVG